MLIYQSISRGALILGLFILIPDLVFPETSSIEQLGVQKWLVRENVLDDLTDEFMYGEDLIEPDFLNEDGQDIYLIGINKGSLLYQAGFRSGDIISTVNDVCLCNGPLSALSLLKELKDTKTELRVDFYREERLMTYTYVFEANVLQELCMLFIEEIVAYLNPLNVIE